MPIRGNFERSELLDLARLQSDGGEVKARISPGLNGNKLCRVVLPRYAVEGACQRSLSRIGLLYPKALSAKGTKHTEKVPAHAANHRVKNRRRDLRDMRPVFADRIADRIQAIRQNASLAQKDGVGLQACALFEAESAWGRLGTATGRPGAAAGLDEECLATISPAGTVASASFASGSDPEKPVASGWLSGAHRCIVSLKRGGRGLSTSLFGMLLKVAPVVGLGA
jgi:hypothetical protein